MISILREEQVTSIEPAHTDVPTREEQQALDVYAEEFVSDFPTSTYAHEHRRRAIEDAWVSAPDGLQGLLDENGQLPADAFV